MTARIARSYVDLDWGQVHVAESGTEFAGAVPPVVCLHQTPRSWDEFREVLQLLGERRHVIALDTPGMGASDQHPDGDRIEAYASGLGDAIAGLGHELIHLVGHHTGGVIAVSLAASQPDLISGLVLSSTAWIDAGSRERRRQHDPVDTVSVSTDGSHLLDLWEQRSAFYPADRADLLDRFVADARRVRDPAAGHLACGEFVMEEAIPHLADIPTLIVGHDADPHAFPQTELLAAQLRSAEVTTIAGGMVPLEFTAARFVEAAEVFLDRVDGHS